MSRDASLSALGRPIPPAREESTLSVASVREMIRKALAEDRRARELTGGAPPTGLSAPPPPVCRTYIQTHTTFHYLGGTLCLASSRQAGGQDTVAPICGVKRATPRQHRSVGAELWHSPPPGPPAQAEGGDLVPDVDLGLCDLHSHLGGGLLSKDEGANGVLQADCERG